MKKIRKKVSLIISLIFILIALPVQIYESVISGVAATIYIPMIASLMYIFRAWNTFTDMKWKGYYVIIPDLIGIIILSIIFTQKFSTDLWGLLNFLK